MRDYEPATVENGSPLGNSLDEIYEGVRGYAVLHKNEIWIPLIEGDGNGKVGEFLDRLSPRCVVVNVCSPVLQGMLKRRGWQMTMKDTPLGDVDVWRKP